jgi:hypothetical protein
VYWAVGTSFFYSILYSIFSPSFTVIAVVNVAMGTLLVWAVHSLARTRFDEAVALIAALLAAVWPAWIAFTSVLSSELLSNLLMATGMAVLLSRSPRFYLRLVFGTLLLVAATYVRPTVLPLIVAVPILDCALRRQWRRAVMAGVIATAIAAVCFAPWVARNDAQFGRPVLVSANFGAVLWMGNNPRSNGDYMELPDNLPGNEALRDEMLRREAVEFIKADPLRYLVLCAKRISLSYSRESIGVAWNEKGLPEVTKMPLKILMALYWISVFTLSLGGVALFLRDDWRRVFDPLIAGVASQGAVSILVIGSDRYHFGLMPFVAIFAALVLQAIKARMRDGAGRKRSDQAPSSQQQVIID